MAADSPAVEPRNCSSAGTKSPVDRPCRYSSGGTSEIFGVFRAHGGRIAEANRLRSPVAPSTRLSFTCGALTRTGPALVVMVRSAWRPFRTTRRRPCSYEFNDENAPERYLPPVGFPYGAAHESEVQYLFGLRNTAYPGVLSAPQQRLAADMKQYWTTFAGQRAPTSYLAPLWPRFDSTGGQMLSLNPTTPSVTTGFAAEHHCVFWALAG